MDDANDLVEAARHFERALELAPHDLEIIRHVVVLLQGLGRLDEAIALGQYAIGRDPVNAPNYANLGNNYRWSRRPEEAISAYRAALRLSPDLGAAQSFIGIALLAQERHPEALESMEREPFEPYRLIGLTMVYHSLGEAAKSDAVLAQLIEQYGHE
ncbi:MAG: tetratricopeptide repeat protein [Gammaproteobacteria bacterium]|nr:tetratricopeptide repeat protein [Gammaproteobacteria bacterium]